MRTTVAMALPILYAGCMSIKEFLRSDLKIRRQEYFRKFSSDALAKLENQYIEEIFSLPLFQASAPIIGCYYAIKEEVPTSRFIAECWDRGFQVALPHVHPDLSMSFHAYHPGDKLEPTALNIPQPSREAQILLPDIMIVPLLGFSRDGHRIGYGLGHYDRVLQILRSKGPVMAIGLAFNCQEVSDIFAQEFDEELDWIITESEVIPRVP